MGHGLVGMPDLLFDPAGAKGRKSQYRGNGFFGLKNAETTLEQVCPLIGWFGIKGFELDQDMGHDAPLKVLSLSGFFTTG